MSAAWVEEVMAQLDWIHEHGENLCGYTYLYGPDRAPAIFQADMDRLNRIMAGA